MKGVTGNAFAGGGFARFLLREHGIGDGDEGLGLAFDFALDGIANVRGDVIEVGTAVRIFANALAVILDAKNAHTFFSRANDGDVTRLGVDAVLANSATAFNGLLWESAMMVIAFQSSPMRSLPVFLPVMLRKVHNAMGAAKPERSWCGGII